jgi:hypothetical protein
MVKDLVYLNTPLLSRKPAGPETRIFLFFESSDSLYGSPGVGTGDFYGSNYR